MVICKFLVIFLFYFVSMFGAKGSLLQFFCSVPGDQSVCRALWHLFPWNCQVALSVSAKAFVFSAVWLLLLMLISVPPSWKVSLPVRRSVKEQQVRTTNCKSNTETIFPWYRGDLPWKYNWTRITSETWHWRHFYSLKNDLIMYKNEICV